MEGSLYRIGIDLDGVLCNFNAGFVAIARKLFGIPGADYVPDSWEWGDSGLTDECIDAVWMQIKATPNFWLNLPAYEENVRALANLLNTRWMETEIVYLTSRVPTLGLSTAQQSDLWLGRHKLLRPGCCVIVKPSNWPKAAIYSILDVPVSVDDYLWNIQQTAPGHQSFLLDRPWNRTGRDPETTVVSSLDEFLSIAVPKEAMVSA